MSKLSKITKKLSQLRNNIDDKGEISEENEAILKSLIGDTIHLAQEDLQNIPAKITARQMPMAHNDNTPLTTDQKFRLRLMEKTGTGSSAIH